MELLLKQLLQLEDDIKYWTYFDDSEYQNKVNSLLNERTSILKQLNNLNDINGENKNVSN